MAYVTYLCIPARIQGSLNPRTVKVTSFNVSITSAAWAVGGGEITARRVQKNHIIIKQTGRPQLVNRGSG